MKQAIILIGIQASGKSTFYRERFAVSYVHISLDLLKTRHREQLLLEDCLTNGKSFAVDNTNPTKEDRARYIPSAKAAGYQVVGYFFESKLQACIERNAGRTGADFVPRIAIAGTSNKLELPSLEEGFDQLYFVRIENGKFIVSEWRDSHAI